MDPINQRNSAVSEILDEFGFSEERTENFRENDAKIDHLFAL